MDYRVPPPISAKAEWTLAKYGDEMKRGKELRDKLCGDQQEKELTKNDKKLQGNAERKGDLKGILRRNGSTSSGRRARFQIPDELEKDKKCQNGKLNNDFHEALQLMIEHPRQSFQFTNDKNGNIHVATKTLGRKKNEKEVFEKDSKVQNCQSLEDERDELNEAMIEDPEDSERFESGTETEYSKGDYHKIPSIKEELDMEKKKNNALQKEIQQANQTAFQWKSKYEDVLNCMKHFKTTLNIWVPEDSDDQH